MRIDGMKWILSISFALGFTFEISRRYVAHRNQERTRLAMEASGVQPYSESRSQIAHSRKQPFHNVRIQPDHPQSPTQTSAQGQFDSSAPKSDEKKAKSGEQGENKARPKCKVDPDNQDGQAQKVVHLAQNDLKDAHGNPVVTPEEDCEPEENDSKDKDTGDSLPFEVSDTKKPENPAEETSTSERNDTPASPLLPASGGQAMTPEFALLQAWKSRLLLSPDFAATVDLIQQFQNNQVSASLFYQLVDLMLAASHAQIQEYGVLAAGRTPSLRSFQVLSSVMSSGTHPQNVKARAESEMRFYEQPQFLNILEAVLKQSSDLQSIILAAQHIDASAQKYLTASNTPPSGGQNQGETATPTSTKSSLQNTYKRLVAALEQIITELPSNQAGQVQQSLTRIKQLLKLPS